MPAVLMTAQFNKFTVKRYSTLKHEQICTAAVHVLIAYSEFFSNFFFYSTLAFDENNGRQEHEEKANRVMRPAKHATDTQVQQP